MIDASRKRAFWSAFSVAFFTLVSRISGLLRETVKAYFLGTGPMADAFNIAFTIPNLFRRLTAEGAMLASFIPHLSDAGNKGKPAAREFIQAFTLKLFLLLCALALGVMFFSEFWIEYVFAPGFDAEQSRYSAKMLRIMFVYIVFISLAAVLQGILNYNNKFGMASFTPIVLNVAIIGAAFLFQTAENVAIAMSWGVVVGGFVQMAMLYPPVRKLDYRIFGRWRFKNATSDSALKNMIPGIWGAGVYQLNIVAGNFIASSLGAGAISALIYSNRLLELALGIFVVSMNTVFFPGFSKTLTGGNEASSSKMAMNAITAISFFTVPVMIGLMLTGDELIRLLFERGQFDRKSTELTWQALSLHLPGMIFIGWNRLFASIFNAYKLFKKLVYISAASTVITVGLSIVLSIYLRHAGIALASSIAQFIQFWVMLFVIVKWRLITIGGLSFLVSVGKHLMAGALIIPTVMAYQYYVSGAMNAWLDYVAVVALAGAVYLIGCRMLRCHEMIAVIGMLKSTRKK